MRVHVKLADIDSTPEVIVDEWDADWDPDSDPENTYDVDGETWKAMSHSIDSAHSTVTVQARK